MGVVSRYVCVAAFACGQSAKEKCTRFQPCDGLAVVAYTCQAPLCLTTVKSLMAAMSGCAESGFGPASTPLEVQRIDDGSEPPVEPPPMRTSCHCWWAPFASDSCTMFAPSVVAAPCTDSALLLWRLISRT